MSFLTISHTQAFDQLDRNVAEYNLSDRGVGLINYKNGKAYDPVSYFVEEGSSALVGSDEFSLVYEEVEYLFSSAVNMKSFLTDTARYEPTFGGWCARAMVAGQKVQINTELFTVVGRRVFFFVNNRAKRFFDRNLEKNILLADKNWKEISGEAPRI